MHELPSARGPLSDRLLGRLDGRPPGAMAAPAVPSGIDPLTEEDLHLALYLCYELHYRGLPGVDERWEWEPSLLALRGALERRFEEALRRDVPVPPNGGPIDVALREIEAADEAPSLSRHLERS